jgi:hypothetical protein
MSLIVHPPYFVQGSKKRTTQKRTIRESSIVYSFFLYIYILDLFDSQSFVPHIVFFFYCPFLFTIIQKKEIKKKIEKKALGFVYVINS